MYEAAIGTTTARPPWAPVELGLLAGRDHEPARRGSIHCRHEEAGATIQWAGPWKRPYAYGEHPEDEVRAVHESLGVIDVSTLGKLLVEGPEAVALLERLYPNRFGDMKPGRIRYGVLTSDGGRIMDDGTIARLADDLFYVTTTSTGADAVTAWFEWWNAVWGYDAEIVNVTGALAAVNLAGPRAREALGAPRRGRRRRLGRGLQVPRREGARGRRRPDPRAADRLRRRARVRAALPEPGRRAPLGRARRARARGRSASSRSACSGSRRGTSSSARTRTRSRTSSRRGCRGSRSWTRTTSSASSRSSTSRSATRRSSSSASRWRRTSCRPRARRS